MLNCIPPALWPIDLTKSSDLCLNCGLCCDGTLFSNVVVTAEGVSPVVAEAGFRLSPDGKSFVQPCQALRSRRCSVYADRPATCRTFRCKLLRALERGTIDVDAATGLVAQASAQRDCIRRDLAGLGPEWTGHSLDGMVFPLEARMKDAQALDDKRKIASVILKLLVLRQFLGVHFLNTDGRLGAAKVPSSPSPEAKSVITGT